MSGHSKWATIKHKKAALDAKRGKTFTRLIKEIMIAARMRRRSRRQSAPAHGHHRRQSRLHARRQHQESHHARHRRTGRRPDRRNHVRRLRARAAPPCWCAVATDNRNRTVSEIRHMFSKNGGNLGEQGSVAWMFERKSQIVIDKDKATEDQLMNLVLEAGAEDMSDNGDTWEVISDSGKSRSGAGGAPEGRNRDRSAEVAMVPKNLMKLEGKNAAGHDEARPKRSKSMTTCRTFTRTSTSTKKKSKRWHSEGSPACGYLASTAARNGPATASSKAMAARISHGRRRAASDPRTRDPLERRLLDNRRRTARFVRRVSGRIRRRWKKFSSP